MRFDKDTQWVGAVYTENLELMADMLAADPALADSCYEAFDDPFRERRFPVSTLVFATTGPPQQVVSWRRVKRGVNLDMVKLLIEAGADPNIESAHGLPLCRTRDEHVAQYLIDHGGDINRWYGNGGGPIYFSIWGVDVARLQMQLRLGADPHQINPENGASLLHGIAEITPEELEDQLEIIQILAEVDVDPNHQAGVDVQSDNGPIYQADTALHMAAGRNRIEVIQALLKIGCDRTGVNAKGKTAFDTAGKHNRSEDILALLSA